MKITVEIEVKRNKGNTAFAEEVHSLLPTLEQLEDFRRKIVPAVLPVKFRIVDSMTQSSFIEFDD